VSTLPDNNELALLLVNELPQPDRIEIDTGAAIGCP
jgi:hypothetical protein